MVTQSDAPAEEEVVPNEILEAEEAIVEAEEAIVEAEAATSAPISVVANRGSLQERFTGGPSFICS